MKSLLRTIALACAFVCPAAYAQFSIPIPTTCVPITGTTQVAAPGTGSLTTGNLTKYSNLPAQVCVGGSTTAYNYTYQAAVTFNNVSRSCAGATWTINGGPVYVYYSGSGTLNLTTQQVTANGQGYYQYDNLTVGLGGVNYTVSSDIVSGRFTYTGTGATTQTTFFVPKGGIPMKVNGSTFNITGDAYRCLIGDASVTVVQE